MRTNKEKCFAALQVADKHALLAKLCEEPVIQYGHEEMVQIFREIAADYAVVCENTQSVKV